MRRRLWDASVSVYVLLIVLLIGCIYDCHGVRYRDFVVPQEVRSGRNATLECQVDTWPKPLYSLAWWKDGAQFYRVAVTKSYHQVEVTAHPLSSSNINFAKLFPLPDVKVEVGRRMGEVVLLEVGVSASGTYTCEVVTDFPTFSQNLLSSNLTVVEPPATKPIISGFKGRYYPGEVLAPNCTILRTHPVPAISWFVNGNQVSGDIIEVRSNPDMTLTVVGRLILRLHKHHFQDGVFNLTCGALVGENLWSATSITARHAHPHRPKEVHLNSIFNHHDRSKLDGTRSINSVDMELSRPYQRLHSGGSSLQTSICKGCYILATSLSSAILLRG
ncbi:uncharacterized protein LOC135202293 [Macrobrachium nipponense]|uniref:uncharacterized protein LOC135202293 n=1 Tax=Macrobrachium nipponense TaxID=159736 RepID=UPI0030C8C709